MTEWTPENLVFDSDNPKIPFKECGGSIILPKIHPLELEDPSHKELRYSQTITNWIIQHFATRIDGEGIIGAGKTEAGEELRSLFPSLKVYREKVDEDVFITFYMDMMLHGGALQQFLANDRKRLNITTGELSSPSYKDRHESMDYVFGKLLGLKPEQLDRLEKTIIANPYRPHMMMHFDCSVETALSRIVERAKKDPKRIFELSDLEGRLLNQEEIASVGRGMHKLLYASNRYCPPDEHEAYLKEVQKKGIPVMFKPQGVSPEYLRALSDEYQKLPDLCSKFNLNTVLATIDVNNIDFKDARYRLALTYAVKYGRCVDLMRKGFQIEESKKEGYFRVTSPYGTTKEFRPDYQ